MQTVFEYEISFSKEKCQKRIFIYIIAGLLLLHSFFYINVSVFVCINKTNILSVVFNEP